MLQKIIMIERSKEEERTMIPRKTLGVVMKRLMTRTRDYFGRIWLKRSAGAKKDAAMTETMMEETKQLQHRSQSTFSRN